MQEKFHLRVNTDITELSQVLDWFESLKDSSIPQQVWLQFQTALAEGFTNVVRHAHKNKPKETPVDIEFEVSSYFLVIRIWDLGPPFDLNAKLAQTSTSVDLNSSNGRGLSILRSVADQLSYSLTEDNRNCLLILKHYTPVQL